MADLISRKDALKNYQDICKGVACADCQLRYDDGECKLERFLRDAPAVDAEPVRQGRWEAIWHSIFKAYLPTCSECGGISPIKYKYCPYCGRRMSERREDAEKTD